jgi:hypothetical protein
MQELQQRLSFITHVSAPSRALRAVVLVPLAGAVMLAGGVGSAGAQPAAAEDDGVARADALFAEGRSLLAVGRVPEACARFEASHRLAPRGGTLLNLALCHEQDGRLVLAHAELQAALAKAREDRRDDRVPIAAAHLAAVAARLGWLEVTPPANVPRGAVEIVIDGDRKLSESEWRAIPVQAGDHAIDVSAKGFHPRRTKVHVNAPGAPVKVVVEALAPAGPVGSGAVAPPAGHERRHFRRFAVAAGAAVVSAAAAVVLGLRAHELREDYHDRRDDPAIGAAAKDAAYDRAATAQHLATGAAVITGALAVTAVVLHFKRPDTARGRGGGVGQLAIGPRALLWSVRF